MERQTALIIIDVQKEFFEKSDMTYKGEELLWTLQQLVAMAREAKVPVIYVQHDGSKGHILEPGSLDCACANGTRTFTRAMSAPDYYEDYEK